MKISFLSICMIGASRFVVVWPLMIGKARKTSDYGG
jgi:hypothetical protein